MGYMTDTQSRESTAERAVDQLSRAGVKGSRKIAEALRLCNGACGGGQQIVAVLYYDPESVRTPDWAEAGRARVLKWRAHSGRWTNPVWVQARDLRKPDVKEKRYRDALASLIGE